MRRPSIGECIGIGVGAMVTIGLPLLLKGRAKKSAPADSAPLPDREVVPAGPVAPAISMLLAQVNQQWPNRNKASDGIMGDAAHQARASDHNTGDAIDFTLDPDNGPPLDALAEALLADPRTKYVIWNKRIRSRTVSPGVWRPYAGSNPHTKHLHLSVESSARNDDRPWTLDAAGIA